MRLRPNIFGIRMTYITANLNCKVNSKELIIDVQFLRPETLWGRLKFVNNVLY
jgi:hypothetical protein